MKHDRMTDAILKERFGKDSLIALATVENGAPHVRTVDSVYIDGDFYVVTHGLSGKMQQIERHSTVGISGEWFTGHGRAQSLGHVLAPENCTLMEILRPAFATWYGNGHVDESDPNTVLLKIVLTDGVLMKHGQRFSFPD